MAIITAIDADSGLKTTVKSRNDGNDDRLLVSTNVDGRTSKIEYQEVTTVPKNTLTTVLSFTNSTGNGIFINGIGGTGTARSEWQIFVDTNLKLRRRMGVAHPFIEIPLFGFFIANGSIIDIKVTHFENATQDFHADLRYSQ